jgi:energy-coupling factor transporter ATP-binding protein EcfA2
MQRITLNNFRVFGPTASFDLAQVTVLTGKNNSGKSSLIKSFLVLGDYLDSKDQTVLRLDGPSAGKHRITSYDTLMNRYYSESNNVVLGYTNGEFEFEYEFDEHIDQTKVSLSKFTMRANALKEELVLQRISRARGVFELSVSQNFIDFLTADPIEKARILNDGQYERELAQAKKELQFFSDGAERVMNEDGEMEYISGQWLKPGDFPGINPGIIGERQQLQKRIRELQRMVGVAKTNAGIFFREEVSLHAEGLSSLTITDLLQEALASYIRADENRKVKRFKFQDSSSERRLLLDFRQRVAELMVFTPFHLGPNRTHQARLFIPQQGSSEIGSVAKAFVQAMVSFELEAGAPPVTTADMFLRSWLKKFGIGEQVIVTAVEDTGYTITVIVDNSIGPVSLADLGFGPGQLLAILMQTATVIQILETRAAMRGNKHFAPALVLIEEPEANLHPMLQSLLAEMFLQLANDFHLLVIIETHSEYMLRKMQILVATEKYATDDIILHYLDRTRSIGADGKADVDIVHFDMNNRRISIMPDGKLSEAFGPGFFDEAGEEALALHRLQRKNLRS